jgi:hypothetical protein
MQEILEAGKRALATYGIVPYAAVQRGGVVFSNASASLPSSASSQRVFRVVSSFSKLFRRLLARILAIRSLYVPSYYFGNLSDLKPTTRHS